MFHLVLDQPQALEQAVAHALAGVAPFDERLSQRLDRLGVGGVEEGHRRPGAGIEFLLALFAQQIAHGDRHVAEIDIDRAGVLALVADGAVVGHVAELVEVLERHAAPGLLFVQEGLDQQRGGENLVARRVEQVGARDMGVAHRLALAAAQAVLDRIGDVLGFGGFEDDRFGFEQAERRRVGVAQVGTAQELALVEAAVRIDFFLVVGKVRQRGVVEEFQLGQPNAVFARDHAAEVSSELHDACDSSIRALQHGVVVGVDRDVCVYVAVAGVHVQGDEDPALQHVLVDAVAGFEDAGVFAADEKLLQWTAEFALP